jgi:hypothetical protein
MKNIMKAHPDKVYGIALNDANGGTDPYETPYINALQSYFIAGSSVSSFEFPCGAISRSTSPESDYANSCIMSKSSWNAQVNAELAKPANCRIGLVTKESGDMLTIDAYVGYNSSVSGNTNLTIMLIEGDLPDGPGGQAGGGTGFMNQHVLRHIITANIRNPIELNSSKKYTLMKFKNVNIAGKYKTKANLKLVAFANIDASETKNYAILNAQEASLNEIKKFD